MNESTPATSSQTLSPSCPAQSKQQKTAIRLGHTPYPLPGSNLPVVEMVTGYELQSPHPRLFSAEYH